MKEELAGNDLRAVTDDCVGVNHVGILKFIQSEMTSHWRVLSKRVMGYDRFSKHNSDSCVENR